MSNFLFLHKIDIPMRRLSSRVYNTRRKPTPVYLRRMRKWTIYQSPSRLQYNVFFAMEQRRCFQTDNPKYVYEKYNWNKQIQMGTYLGFGWLKTLKTTHVEFIWAVDLATTIVIVYKSLWVYLRQLYGDNGYNNQLFDNNATLYYYYYNTVCFDLQNGISF